MALKGLHIKIYLHLYEPKDILAGPTNADANSSKCLIVSTLQYGTSYWRPSLGDRWCVEKLPNTAEAQVVYGQLDMGTGPWTSIIVILSTVCTAIM